MFLSTLTLKQRKVFLGLAKEILTIDDGIIDTNEEDYLRSLCSEMSLSFNDDSEIDKNQLQNIFDTKEVKKVILLELVALGHSNKDYHEVQDKYTDEICYLLNISIDELRDIENLLKKYHEIQEKFIQFIEN